MKIFVVNGLCDSKYALSPHPRGNEELEGEIRILKEHGYTLVVSMLTPEEQASLGLQHEQATCSRLGLQYLNYLRIDNRNKSLSILSLSAYASTIATLCFNCPLGHVPTKGRSNLEIADYCHSRESGNLPHQVDPRLCGDDAVCSAMPFP